MTAPLLLGHRGARASRTIPENTLASFELCLEHGCDGFEFDVRLSSDRQAVICHDAWTGKTDIASTAAVDLSLPALDDVLRQFADRAFLDIELKVVGLEAQTLASLRAFPSNRGYVVSSFLPEVLMALRVLDTAIPLGLLCENQRQLNGWRQTPAQWVMPHLDLVDRDLIEQIHLAGKRTMLWTVNRPEMMREFAELGVDAIISDETELLVRSLR
jgi:glycerophosphoryl diester phosphodiesterase